MCLSRQDRKKILFVVQGLARGGTEWTLIEALNVIDYSKYDVTLYVRKQNRELQGFVNSCVEVIVNDAQSESKDFIDKMLLKIATIFERLSRKGISKACMRMHRKYILRKRICEEKKKLSGIPFDVAVAYDMANDCANFVREINATEKYVFFHGSVVDETKYKAYSCFNKVITVNELAKETFKKMYPSFKGQVETVENFIDISRVRQLAKKETSIKIEKENLILCSCGRLTKEKGFDLAVEAANIIKETGIAFKWYFVGSGIERENLEKRVHAYNLEENVCFAGFAENPYKYMASCDIYIQPSREESYGISMVECLALHKPIISTATIGGIYLAKHFGGLTLTSITAENIAERIVELYHDQEKLLNMVVQSEKIDWDFEYNRYVMKFNDLFK